MEYRSSVTIACGSNVYKELEGTWKANPEWEPVLCSKLGELYYLQWCDTIWGFYNPINSALEKVFDPEPDSIDDAYKFVRIGAENSDVEISVCGYEFEFGLSVECAVPDELRW